MQEFIYYDLDLSTKTLTIHSWSGGVRTIIQELNRIKTLPDVDLIKVPAYPLEFWQSLGFVPLEKNPEYLYLNNVYDSNPEII